MYKEYKIKIIKNDIYLPKKSESDESDYEYLYNDELQIFSETDNLLFNLKDYEFKRYENIGKYLIVDIDEGHKFSMKNIFINLDTFTIYYQIFIYKERTYRIHYDKEKKCIDFKDCYYDIEYFFENMNNILETFEWKRHTFNANKDTLLKGIFDMFGKTISSGQIKIDGFTYGMRCHDIEIFKNIQRDHTKTIEKQLFDVLFGHTLKNNNKIYDIDLTIHYCDIDEEDKKIRISLECRDKEPKEINGDIIYYGYYDENAKLKLI